ncbi:MAG: flagellar basal body-associated protein FliL [Solirubrobacterales bacterium]
MEGKEKKGKEKKAKGKPLIYVIIIILLLVIIGGGGYFGFKLLGQSKGNNTVKETVKAVPELTYGLDEFLVNLADEGSTRYVKVKVYIGYDNKKLTEEMKTNTPAIRDTIIKVLRSKKAQDFSDKGTEAIKSEILEKINPLLSKGRATEIYFYDILVQ